MKNVVRLLLHLFLLRPFIRIFFGINIYGKENIYKLSKYTIIANHNSHLDILLLFYSLPIKHILITHPVAAKEYFSKSKLLFHLVNFLFDPIWITRGTVTKHSNPLEEVKKRLDIGHNIIVFPEGTRGTPGKIQHFKSGIGRLAEQYHNVPIVPIFLFGPERSLPKPCAFPIPIWNSVVIGPPQMFKESHIDITNTLEKIVRELSETETALRHKRISKKTKSTISIAVLGIDGSGKSTISENLSKLLSNGSSVALVSDTLKFYENSNLRQMQPILTEKIRVAIGKYAKNAKSLKLYKIPKLSELLLRDSLLVEIKKWYKPDFIILDGSPLLNLTAWAILYKEKYFNEAMCLKAIKILSAKEEIKKNDLIYKEFPELLSIKRLGLNHLKIPNIVVFLNVEPNIAIDRIRQRGEDRQAHETEDKLSKLSNAYHMTCNVIKRDLNISTHIMNSDDSIDNITSAAFGYIDKCLKGELACERPKD